jgi:hypothetical protein
MAQLGAVAPVYATGEGKRFVVFRLTGVNSGDTFDVRDELRRVDAASAYSPSNMKPQAMGTAIVGTIVTITNVDLNNDVVYLSVGGAAA